MPFLIKRLKIKHFIKVSSIIYATEIINVLHDKVRAIRTQNGLNMDQYSPEELKILRNCNFLKELSTDLFNEILLFSKRISAKKGEMILQENQESDMLYIILSGSVGLFKSNENDLSQCMITSLSSGESLGEMRLVESRVCSLSAVAEEDMNLFALSITDLTTKDKSHCLVQLLKQVIRILNARLQNENLKYVAQFGEKNTIKRKFSYALFSITLLIVILIQSGFLIFYLMFSDEFCKITQTKVTMAATVNEYRDKHSGN
jgi:CRP-like cAMP-binding protein